MTVISYTSDGEDALGNRVRSESGRESVGNVLVAVGPQKDASAANRPDGAVVVYTLYFPKTYKGDPTGCDVLVRGHTCRVIGNPDRYPVNATHWDMECEVADVEG